MTISFKDYIEFKVKDKKVILISDEVNGMTNTVAQIDTEFYYLGSEYPNIFAAVDAYQQITGSILPADEYNKILKDNDF